MLFFGIAGISDKVISITFDLFPISNLQLYIFRSKVFNFVWRFNLNFICKFQLVKFSCGHVPKFFGKSQTGKNTDPDLKDVVNFVSNFGPIFKDVVSVYIITYVIWGSNKFFWDSEPVFEGPKHSRWQFKAPRLTLKTQQNLVEFHFGLYNAL